MPTLFPLETVKLFSIIAVSSLVGIFFLILFYSIFKRNLREKLKFFKSLKMIPLEIALPKGKIPEEKEKIPQKEEKEMIGIAEAIYTGLSSLKEESKLSKFLFGKERLSFEIVAQKGQISFFVVCPEYLQDLVEKQIHAQYPAAHIEPCSDYNIFFPESKVACAEFIQTKSPIFPFRSYKKTETDPLNTLTGVLSKFSEKEGGVIQILIKEAPKIWQKSGLKTAKEIQKGKSLQEIQKSAAITFLGKSASVIEEVFSSLLEIFRSPSRQEPSAKTPQEPITLSPIQQEQVKTLEEKASLPEFCANIRIVTSSSEQAQANLHLRNIINAFSQFTLHGFNGLSPFIPKKEKKKEKMISHFIYRFFNEKRKNILNTEELASLWHLPTIYLETPNIKWLAAKKAPAPLDIPKEGIILGKNSYRGIETVIKIKKDDRRRHVYIIGMTGSGKSVLMSNMAIQDIKNGEGVGIIDPHGSLVEDILPHIPKERIDDVIYFNPADIERPIGLNLLEAETSSEKDMAIQEMISIFYKLVTDPAMLGPMFEHNMRNAMLTLMADPSEPGTLVEIPRIFTDKEFQEYKLKKVTNPVVRGFWEKEMAKTTEFHRSEMLGYLISKVGRFIENEMMRNIIGQPHSGFDLKEIIRNKKILLINLSKGRIGEICSNLLGLLIVSKIQLASFSQAELPESERKDFFLYIDEFQNYTTDTIATILAEARKYRLCLTLAHQYIGQLLQKAEAGGKETGLIRDAVFGNVGTMISFRIGVEDAETMAKQFAPVFNEYDVINIERFNAYVRLLINNQASKAFNMQTFPPFPGGNPEIATKIKELSRNRYGKVKEEIEKEILRRSRLGEKDLAQELGRERNL